MSVVIQLYFHIVEENNYMFQPSSGWAIIRLRLEYRRKLIYYNVDIKNVGCWLVESCGPPTLNQPTAKSARNSHQNC
jgi:hypothetical protein